MYNKNLMPRWAEGNSLEDVREKLFQEYGTDYEILDYKAVIKSGFFHLNEHEVYRVQYVVKDNQFDDLPQKPLRTGGVDSSHSVPLSVAGKKASSPLSGGNRLSEGQPYSNSMSVPHQTQPVSTGSAADDFAANQNKLLASLGGSDAITQVKLNAMSKKLDSIASTLSKVSESSSVKDEQKTLVKIASLLEQNEFSQSYINEIKERIRGEFNLEELDDEELVMDQVVDWIGEDFSISPRFSGKKKPHVIIIVGPTGVGKTTTIAKMAAEIKMAGKDTDRSPVIHMITTDTIRVAAKEQIERYAEVMELNVDKVDTKEDLEKLIGLYNGSRGSGDFVFIDTSGFSPKDYDHISKLQDMLDVRNLKADIYLAVSATTKSRDLDIIFKNYEAFGFRSVIVTKCDETTTYGNILSVLHEKRKSVSWITVGQEILHTLERASPIYFLRNLDGFEVDREHLDKKFGNGSSGVSNSLGE